MKIIKVEIIPKERGKDLQKLSEVYISFFNSLVDLLSPFDGLSSALLKKNFKVIFKTLKNVLKSHRLNFHLPKEYCKIAERRVVKFLKYQRGSQIRDVLGVNGKVIKIDRDICTVYLDKKRRALLKLAEPLEGVEPFEIDMRRNILVSLKI